MLPETDLVSAEVFEETCGHDYLATGLAIAFRGGPLYELCEEVKHFWLPHLFRHLERDVSIHAIPAQHSIES